MTPRLHFKAFFFGLWKGNTLLKHCVGWSIFILYELSFIRLSIGSFSPAKQYIGYYSLNILLFYINAGYVFPLAIKSKRSYLLIPLFGLIELVIYLILKYALDCLLAFSPNWKLTEAAYIHQLLVPNAYRGIYFLGFSILYWSFLRITAFRKKVHETETKQLMILKEKAELERNLAEAMNAYLQQQINPHFLFNTLTFIHNTYYKHSREAAQCVILLVDIMRFSLDEVDFYGKTALGKEIEQIENFIELNQLRFDHDLKINFLVEGDYESQVIIPLILLTLTENVFKHGNLKQNNEEAILHISINERSQLRFFTRNRKKHQPENKRIKSIGIANVIKRLEHSYRHQYELKISDEDEIFELELMMQL